MPRELLTDLVRGTGRPLVFAGNPLDRADARRDDSVWLKEKLADPTSRFIVLSDLRPLMATKPALDILYLGAEALAGIIGGGALWVFLGLDGARACFALDVTGREESLPESGERKAKFIDARSVAIQFATPDRDRGRAGLIGLARALIDWHVRHRFCARCGSQTRVARGGFLRRCEDSACAAEHFPRTDPVVIMLALNGDSCLLGRSPKFPEGVYSALAGFMEPGESIEEAVRRELTEEAGIEAGGVRYLASQPWPFQSSLMIGCYVDALTTEIRLDGNELEDALWMKKNIVRDILNGNRGTPVLVPTRMAIAATLLRNWALGEG